MLKFFSHKKFWLPFLTILILIFVLELVLRLNLYNLFLKSNSHLGESYQRYHALKKFGLDNIHWITVGDSRIDWSVDHRKLKNAQLKNDINHLRMSFGGSDFMAIQGVINWSLNNMKSLKGVVIGVSENKLTQGSSFNKLYPIIWPFRQGLNFKDYTIMPADKKKWRWFYGLAIVNYYQDIKDFFGNPIKRMNQLSRQPKDIYEVFNYRRENSNDICGFNLQSLEACVELANLYNNTESKTIPEGLELPINLCKSKLSQRRLKSGKPVREIKNVNKLVTNWQLLIDNLVSHEIKVVFVILPDHEMYDYLLKPSNAKLITERITDNYNNNPYFKLLNLQNGLGTDDQCQYYSDPLHLNTKGGQLLTDKLLMVLNSLD